MPASTLPPLRKVAIVGVGLVGGSLGLALRQRGLARRVVGIGHRQSSVDQAVELGAVDEGTLDIAAGVAEAELTVLATPVGVMVDVARQARDHIPSGSVVTDVGSTKAWLVRQLEQLADGHFRYVGSHPMAGSEKRGVGEASAELFEGALCFLVATSRTDHRALDLLADVWQALGGKVRVSDPAEHDRLVAMSSHLPHLVAAALVNVMAPDAMACTGAGFRDTTRVASGDPRLWADVCLQNRDRILEALQLFASEVHTLRDILGRRAEAELLAWLESAKAVRDHHVRP
ncbi:MAG: prephenate dehydrogenase [Candidatus Brocadiia bacterium]